MKKVALLFILLSIVLMSIGYSALNIQLSISGEALVKGQTNILITNISFNESIDGGYETFSSSFTDDTTSMYITLPSSSSSVTLDIEITNQTSDNYKLESIEQLISSNPMIKYELIDHDCLHLKPNSVNTISIKFYYYPMMGTMNNVSLSLKYIFKITPYEKLDYITSTGSQYIDTGIMNTGDYLFESEFLPTTKAKGEGVWLFSGRKITSKTVGLYFFISSLDNFTINSYGGSTGSNSSIRLPKNTWYNMYFSRNEFTINGINIPVYSNQIVPEADGASILLGGNLVNWDGSVDIRQYEGDMKYFKITDVVTNEVLRHFIPVKLSDTGEVGFWDLIEDKFYSNDGAGIYLEP